MSKPLIGITDFTNFDQVKAMLQIFNNHRKSPQQRRQLHVGVMMSYKTLHEIPSKWENVFPRKESIFRIFSSTEVYNCLHFADYENHPKLWKNLCVAISYGGVHINGLQLDMIWPNPDEIKRAIKMFPLHKIEVILQVGREAFEKVGNKPEALVQKLKEYDGVIDRVLLDKSGGRGIGMNALELLPFMRAIKNAFPQLNLVVAGGLGPNTVHLLEPILPEFPDISIDAQGKLRPSGNALDPVDWSMAGDYLINALKFMK